MVGAKATIKRLGCFQILWPNVQTDEGTACALKAGTFALIYFALLNGISAAAAVFSAILIELSPSEANSFPVPYMLIMVASMIMATATASMLSVLVWKKGSLMAACIGLTWILCDAIGHRGISLTVPAIPFSISGVRGTYAARRFREGRTKSPEE
jgi:hypothetical protein